MQHFIERLETRALLSATTAAALAADKTLIAADAAAAKADLASLFATDKADDVPILAALKGVSPSTNGPLLKTLKADEAKGKAAVNKALAGLLNPGRALANKSASAGDALLKKWTAKGQAKVTADIAGLDTVCTAPLATLQADLASTTINDDLNALNAANPSVTSLSADIATRENAAATQQAVIGTAAVKFQTDIGTQAGDLGAIPVGSTIPNVVGNYTGSATETAGAHVGQSMILAFQITNEGVDGSFAGTGATTDKDMAETVSVSGSVTAGGSLTLTFTDTGAGQQGGATLTGRASGKKFSGTFVGDTGDSGRFTITMS